MQRSEQGVLTRLRREAVRSRLIASAMRQDLIEALGDWLCGSGAPPPPETVEALALLSEAQEAAERRYADCLAAQIEKQSHARNATASK